MALLVALLLLTLSATKATSQTLTASPNILTISHGENVMIAWRGIESPTTADWIAIYSPSSSADDDYFDYYEPNAHSTSGNFSYMVVNMRTDYIFKYWRAASDTNKTYTLIATSNVVEFQGGQDEPLQGHLSLTEYDDEMRLMWVTNSSNTPQVIFGTKSGVYTFNATGVSATYTAEMMCGSPANVTSSQNFRPPGYNHDVLLTGLKTDTIYYYRFGNKIDGFSPEYSFRSRASSAYTLKNGNKFLIYGDMGAYDYRCGCPGAPATVAKLVTDALQDGYPFDLALHIGDISYAIGRSYMWDQFFLQIEPIATRIPYMVGIGNHDYVHTDYKRDPSGAPGNGFHPSWGNYNDDSGGECSVPTYFKFHMPDQLSTNKMSPYWYSYDYGLVHFVVVSTEHNFTFGSEQYLWLENDLALASKNRQNVPWIIFNGHRPMYESENYPSDTLVAAELRYYLEDLLYTNKVNLALWGHYHSYQRTCPVYKEECVGYNSKPGATVHVTVGSAGADLDDVNYIPSVWAEYSTYNFGYIRLTVPNATSMHLEFVQTFTNVTGGVVDAIWLNSWN